MIMLSISCCRNNFFFQYQNLSEALHVDSIYFCQSPLPSNACPGQVLCMCSLFLRQATSRDRAPHLTPILTADARPDFSSFSMSAHSSCHSSHFTHMELLAKVSNDNFLYTYIHTFYFNFSDFSLPIFEYWY